MSASLACLSAQICADPTSRIGDGKMDNKRRSPSECPARVLFWHARTNAIMSCDRVTRSTYLQTQSAQNLPIAHPDVPAPRSRRKRKGNAMSMSDWQSPAAYEHARDIAAAGMAWEYLRRDDEYRRAFQRMKTTPAPKPRRRKAFSERWGLRFPCRSGAASRSHACFLDTGTLA